MFEKELLGNMCVQAGSRSSGYPCMTLSVASLLSTMSRKNKFFKGDQLARSSS